MGLDWLGWINQLPGGPRDLSDRVSDVERDVTTVKGSLKGHEDVCTFRYNQIRENQSDTQDKINKLDTKVAFEFDQQNKKLDNILKIGGVMYLVMILLEVGKLSGPALVELLSKVFH